MKLPLRWLNEFVTLDADVDELCRRLTVAGLEVESVEERGARLQRRVRRARC